MTAADPYVGPRPFQRGEEELFFGRLGESRLLVSMVLASRVVLLYALSGAGKTSLLNAAVVPALEREEFFEVLAPARVRGPVADDGANADGNPYVAGVLSHWADPHEERAKSLAALFARRSHPRGPDGFPRPRAVILDQLEEVFTAYPEHWRKREELFRQLAEALAQDPLLRVILAIREDYLAQLEPFRALLPDRLENRLRLELLDPEAARDAVEGPLRATDRRFAAGVAERLVADLRTAAITEESGARREFEGEHVEPVQLQLACSALWRDLPPDVSEITEYHVSTFGDVDQVLTEFYDDAIAASAQAAGVGESLLRREFTDTFITSMHTRGTAYAGDEQVGRVPLPAIEELERRRLIRAEWRANARWFELTHDRLIEPIERSNQAALLRTASDLGRGLRGVLGALGGVIFAAVPAAWLGIAVRSAPGLGLVAASAAYRGVVSAVLFAAAALGWTLATRGPAPWRRAARGLAIGGAAGAVTNLIGRVLFDAGLGIARLIQYALLGALIGRLGVIAPSGRRASVGAAVGGAAGGLLASSLLLFYPPTWTSMLAYVLVVVGAWAPELARGAWGATPEGESPAVSRSRRRPTLVLGLGAVAIAAVAAAAIAVGEIRTARSDRSILLSRGLAAQSQAASDPQLAGLLSVEAWRARATPEAEAAMTAALAQLQPKRLAGGGQVLTVAISPDGRTVAAAGTDGAVRRFGIPGLRRAVVIRGASLVSSLAFSPDGRTLAAVGDSRVVRLWSRVITAPPKTLSGPSPSLTSVDFAPAGGRLAAAGSDGSVLLFGLSPARLLAVARPGSLPVAAVRFSPDGRTLASGGADGRVRLWDFFPSLVQASDVRGARGGVLTVAFSPDGAGLATAGADGRVQLRSLSGPTRETVLTGHTGSIYSVVFSPNGKRLASAGDDGTVRVWQLDDPSLASVVVRGFTGPILSLAFTPDGRTLAAGGADGTVRLLGEDVWSGNPEAVLSGICHTLTRSLTRAEWDRFLPGDPYRGTCG